MSMIHAKAALVEIEEAIESQQPFIMCAYFSETYGRAACSQAFKEANLSERGYRKAGSVWFRK